MLLIPYGVKGWAEYIRWADKAWVWIAHRPPAQKKEDIQHFFSRKNGPLLAGAALLLVVLILFGQTELFRRTIALDDNAKGIDAREQFYRIGIWEPEE